MADEPNLAQLILQAERVRLELVATLEANERVREELKRQITDLGIFIQESTKRLREDLAAGPGFLPPPV